MKAALGRADLVRLIADLPPDRSVRVAALLGFEAPLEGPPRRDSAADSPATAETNPPKEAAPTSPLPSGPMPFWRIESMTFAEEQRPRNVAPQSAEVLTQDDMQSPGRSLFATPPAPPLEPWSRLWPRLRTALQTTILGREPDMPKALRAVARGEILSAIPRRMRAAWSGHVSVWVDRSARLLPFASDQSDVCHRLRRVCGKSGFRIRSLDRRTQARSMERRGDLLRGYRPDPMTPILALGDLGVYGTSVDRLIWLRTARRLRLADVRITALLPAPPGRWDPFLARAWSAIPWELGRLRGGITSREDPAFWRERAERLLRITSMAAWIQPGLLRAMRRLLPARDVDAAAEVDVWSHPDVRSADATGVVLHPEAASRWRARFATEVDADLKARVSLLIKRWHEGLPKELLRAETLVWHALVPESITAPPGDLEDARGFARRLEGTVKRRGGDVSSAAMIQRFGQSMLRPGDAGLFEKVPELKTLWVASFQGVDGVQVPEGIDPSAIRAAFEATEAPRSWSVRQVGSELRISPSPWGSTWPSDTLGPGSPIAWLLAASPVLWLTRLREGSRIQLRLNHELVIPLRPHDEFKLETDTSTITIRPWRREPWASSAGMDRFGLWADVDIGGVVQRFRWIPPGRFLMGSPETEAGRWEDEGPQHLVTWTKGRWLADTPVTQALWEAVMGTNPSYFKSPERPVEGVNWYTCQTFIRKLNKLNRGLDARLPTEAEWEHACRGGTSTATWIGDLEILGENNAPRLDSITWYGGNSGHGFDLSEGYDSSDWPNKQYDHICAGTRPVHKKRPNPFGLYDMLGNVLEWCDDVWSTYNERAVVDPRAVHLGVGWVCRGGSWSGRAKDIRAAYRVARTPNLRAGYLGFRLARGPAPGHEAESELPSGLVSQGEESPI